MTRTIDNDERLEYHNGGVKYIIIKTNPPKLITEVDFSDNRLANLEITWQSFAEQLDAEAYSL